MTQEYNYMFLNRLAVFSNGKVVYDEKFHEGVNIIRGSNSHGKSTIIDFIFYALGGENLKWKKEAKLCDFVLAEIDVNSNVWTLRRRVTTARLEGIDIYEGSMDDAEKNLSGWIHYASIRANNRESYSQVLFSFLGIPNINEDGERITIHKILRALYIDQNTPQDTFLYSDTWDSGTIRQMIGDVLFGVYSEKLFSSKSSKRNLEQKFEMLKREEKNFISHIKTSGLEINKDVLKLKIAEVEQKISSGLNSSHPSETFDERLSQLNMSLVETEKEIKRLSESNLDSSLFVEALERKLNFLKQSEKTNNVLADVSLHVCPVCNSELSSENVADNCPLCKNKINGKKAWNITIRMRQEILYQIKESRQLMSDREININTLFSNKERLKEEIDRITQLIKSDKILLTSIANDIPIESIYRVVEWMSFKEKLIQNSAILETLDSIRIKKNTISNKIAEENNTISEIESSQKLQKEKIARSIDRIARRIVETDILHKREFIDLSPIEIDFYNNTFFAGNRNNFSASSQAYLKNSVHFALFFSATLHASMLYPRFILCDNTEDKGLVAERSQVFQREIIKLSHESKAKHQVILTTSMIAPELNNHIYCVGDELVGDKYSLNL
ncbi:AAA family ATPase [uncultured Desulfovibrio sp.]|uniref:AAA family ATPase n=1 Tax=uncultured Desulfovibrio sp. TaxID=167968 RepID=UPI002868549F|nr:AAA family ATPase [uncultured Desulfovibrio sp.]